MYKILCEEGLTHEEGEIQIYIKYQTSTSKKSTSIG